MTTNQTTRITTADLAALKGFRWVMYRGTHAKVDRIHKLQHSDGYVVDLTRYNMCGTELCRVSVHMKPDETWELIENPAR